MAHPVSWGVRSGLVTRNALLFTKSTEFRQSRILGKFGEVSDSPVSRNVAIHPTPNPHLPLIREHPWNSAVARRVSYQPLSP
jgi:hypothetical protein